MGQFIKFHPVVVEVLLPIETLLLYTVAEAWYFALSEVAGMLPGWTLVEIRHARGFHVESPVGQSVLVGPESLMARARICCDNAESFDLVSRQIASGIRPQEFIVRRAGVPQP